MLFLAFYAVSDVQCWYISKVKYIDECANYLKWHFFFGRIEDPDEAQDHFIVARSNCKGFAFVHTAHAQFEVSQGMINYHKCLLSKNLMHGTENAHIWNKWNTCRITVSCRDWTTLKLMASCWRFARVTGLSTIVNMVTLGLLNEVSSCKDILLANKFNSHCLLPFILRQCDQSILNSA